METITESEITRRRSALEQHTGTWVPRSLAAAFDTAADRFGDRPALITGDGTLSYAEVRDQSMRLAAGLIALGVSPGDRVALLVDNRAEYLPIKFAIARIGAIAVPLNYSYRRDEIRERLQQSRASVLISIDASVATNFLEVFDDLFPGWENAVQSDELPELRHVVLVDDSREGALTVHELATRGDRTEVQRRTDAVHPDDVCDIVFTSGTTGHAIGAELTHDMVLRSAYGSAYHRAFDDGWRVSFALPLYHVFGYVEGMLAVIFVGGAIAPLKVFNPKTVLTVIEDHRINEVLFVPTMTVAVVDQATKGSYDLSSLQSVFSAAAPAPVWLWEKVMTTLRPSMIFTGYGQTEVSAATALTLPGDDIETVSAMVGTPKLGGSAAQDTDSPDGRLATYRTLDPFTGHPLPAGETGELSVRGPQVTHRYFESPERTAAAIDDDGWLRTGDLGRINERGYLELTGRSSELFKVGGELVAPIEIEQVLTALPGVSQAYVAGVPDERFGEVCWAWVVSNSDATLDERELIAACRTHLAPFKVPRGISLVTVDQLPITTTGKVQKFLLVQEHARLGG